MIKLKLVLTLACLGAYQSASTATAGDTLSQLIKLETFEKLTGNRDKASKLFGRYTKLTKLNKRKHNLWEMNGYASFKDRAVSPNTKGHSKSFTLGYDYKLSPKWRLGMYATALRGRSFATNFFRQTVTNLIQPINAWSLSHAQSISPFFSYNFTSWASAFVAASCSWGRTRLVQTRTNPFYGVGGTPNVQGKNTTSYMNTSSKNLSAYMNFVAPLSSEFMGQAQIGGIFVRSKRGKFMLYQPYLNPADYNLVNRNHDNSSTGVILLRVMYGHFDMVTPYMELGMTA
ncbi:MAG: autotransporter outer membrane beta-barrel domain-containing protein, partial [Alphaproteobacteria bacterium]|nr:autotransporter outer membrane beta-barrel domain-containing protein [Alphaproteobacteria bacterium]